MHLHDNAREREKEEEVRRLVLWPPKHLHCLWGDSVCANDRRAGALIKNKCPVAVRHCIYELIHIYVC